MKDATEIACLARLLETGTIRAGRKNEALIHRFETARWVMPGSRKEEWVLRQNKAHDLENRLSILLPTWRVDFELLRSIGRDHFDISDIAAIPMLRRNTNPSGRMVNRRNWNAAVGLSPKHKAKIPAQCLLTKDWVLRIRPNKGLIGITDTGDVELDVVATMWTECVIPERAWMGFNGFAGVLPMSIITCENLGAYIDLPASETTLVVYSPGADTEAAVALLKLLPDVPWMHFGDLDPEGVDIARRIAKETGRVLKLAILGFANDYLDASMPVETPWGEVPDIPLLTELKKMKKRIFQEVFMLDKRLAEALAIMHV
jgi:hypothetical protein